MSPPGRVLLVEDEELTREALAVWIESRGFDVLEAADGESALAICQREDFDLALVDLRLGRMSGAELLEHVRRIRPGARVILMTAYLDDETERRVRSLGADGILSKPFAPETLTELLVRFAS